MGVESFSDREPSRRRHRRWLLLLLLLLFLSTTGLASWRFYQPPRATPTHATWLDPPRADSSQAPRAEKRPAVDAAPPAAPLDTKVSVVPAESPAPAPRPQHVRQADEKEPVEVDTPAPPERHVVMGFKVKPDERGFTRLQYNRPREAAVDRAGDIKSLRRGDRLTLDLPGVGSRDFRVKQTHRGEQIASMTAHGEGERRAMVYLERRGRDDVRGRVLLWDRMVSYAFWTDADGAVHIERRHAASEICYKFPVSADADAAAPDGAVAEPIVPASDEPAITAALNAANTAGGLAVPVLSSRPSATAVIYVDFDGHTDNSGAWAGGATIVAAPFDLDGNTASFTTAERDRIVRSWRHAREDFLPFDVNVTTDESAFNAAPANRRVRAVVTITKDAAPSAGGVAYLNSFTWTSDVPCWVYNRGENSLGLTISHEVGHTLGLRHDGLGSQGYHSGHGTAPTSWGPIMGAPFSAYVTPWSKGEYANSNETEDDLAIITGSNGFGYSTDDHGDSTGTATTMVIGPGAVNEGVIEQTGDVDLFSFTWLGGTLTIEASPRDSRLANLDIRARILNSGGGTVIDVNPTNQLDVLISQNLAAGSYFLQIEGVGFGDPYGSPPDGYTDYGSIGFYAISHNISNSGAPTVAITSPSNGTNYPSAPATVAISASASDPDGIDYVEFYQGATLLGTDTTAPYSHTWNSVPVGNYTLTARAYDNLGAVATSAGVGISVTSGPPPPTTPTVLSASVIAYNRVDLSWTGNLGVTYQVQRAVGGGGFSTIATVGPNVSTYEDTTVAFSTQYTYRVIPNGGSNSNSVTVTTPGDGQAGSGLLTGYRFLDAQIRRLVAQGNWTYTDGVFRKMFSPHDTVVAINAGGPEAEAEDGTSFSADTMHEGGAAVDRAAVIDGAAASEDPLYRTARVGESFVYEVPVPDGVYEVALEFVETEFAEVGDREFSVSLEGNPVLTALDLVSDFGANRLTGYVFEVKVLDRQLDIAFEGLDGAEALINTLHVRYLSEP